MGTSDNMRVAMRLTGASIQREALDASVGYEYALPYRLYAWRASYGNAGQLPAQWRYNGGIMALKGTGFSKSDTDWRCKCGKWHRARTIRCQCGLIPRLRRTRASIRSIQYDKNWRNPDDVSL